MENQMMNNNDHIFYNVTRIADNIRLLLKESKTIKQTQDNLKKNFITQNSCVGNINRFWCILDIYSIDEYVKKIFEKTDKNRYSNIFNRYALKAKSQNLDVWNVPILLEYIAELIFINKDILTKWDSIIK